MRSLLAMSDGSDVHTAIIACIQNRTQNNGEKERRKGWKNRRAVQQLVHTNDVAVDTTATTTRRRSSNEQWNPSRKNEVTDEGRHA